MEDKVLYLFPYPGIHRQEINAEVIYIWYSLRKWWPKETSLWCISDKYSVAKQFGIDDRDDDAVSKNQFNTYRHPTTTATANCSPIQVRPYRVLLKLEPISTSHDVQNHISKRKTNQSTCCGWKLLQRRSGYSRVSFNLTQVIRSRGHLLIKSRYHAVSTADRISFEDIHRME